MALRRRGRRGASVISEGTVTGCVILPHSHEIRVAPRRARLTRVEHCWPGGRADDRPVSGGPCPTGSETGTGGLVNPWISIVLARHGPHRRLAEARASRTGSGG